MSGSTPNLARARHEGPLEIAQDDTFFNCATGRLKLRAFSNDAGELIFYQRVNQRRPERVVLYTVTHIITRDTA